MESAASDDLSGGEIAGVVIGVIALCALFGLAVYAIHKPPEKTKAIFDAEQKLPWQRIRQRACQQGYSHGQRCYAGRHGPEIRRPGGHERLLSKRPSQTRSARSKTVAGVKDSGISVEKPLSKYSGSVSSTSD